MAGLKPRGSMRVLHLDIETTPALVWTYGLWNQNIGIGQIEKPPEIMGWATMWHGDKSSSCKYTWADAPGAYEELWAQMDEATHVSGFNSNSFDLKWLNHEFIKKGVNGGAPPSPYKRIDLMRIIKQNTRSISNKLAFLSTDLLGFEGKVDANALTLFLRIEHGTEKEKAKARAEMERYCRRDVTLLPKMLDAILPWVTGLNTNAYTGDLDGCPNCGSTDMQKRGSAYTGVSRFQRYRCNRCGTWSRDKKSLDVTERRVVS